MRIVDDDGDALAINDDGSLLLGGNVAHDSADSGGPVKIGGKAETTVPTAVADADRVDAWFDEYGRQVVASSVADIIDVTLTLDTSAYVSGDVLSDTATVTNAVKVPGGRGRLTSVVVLDEDDQKLALDVVFMSATASLGTKNSAPNISDADARNILGFVSIVAGDYIDLGGVGVATKSGLNLIVEAASGSRDLFIGTITRGTPTYTVNGLRVRLGIVAD